MWTSKSQWICSLKTEKKDKFVVNKWKTYTFPPTHVGFRGKNGTSERMSPNSKIIEFTWHKI